MAKRTNVYFDGYNFYYKDIPRDILAKCQLPDSIPYRKNQVITKPAAWAKSTTPEC